MKRSPIFRNSDEHLRRLEREARRSPDDAALQEQFERELIRVQGGDLVPQWRSVLLVDLESFCLSLHNPAPNWLMLERLSAVMSEFAGLSVDSVMQRFRSAEAEYGRRDGMSLWGTERLVREVGLQGMARAIANASSAQVRRYWAVRDEVGRQTGQWANPPVRRNADDQLRRLEREAATGDQHARVAFIVALERTGAPPERIVFELFMALKDGARAASEMFVRRAIVLSLEDYARWAFENGFIGPIPASYIPTWGLIGGVLGAEQAWRTSKERDFTRYTLIEPLEQEIAWWRLLAYLGDADARRLLAGLPPLDAARSHGWGTRTLVPPAKLGERFVRTLDPSLVRELAIAGVSSVIPMVADCDAGLEQTVVGVIEAAHAVVPALKQDMWLSRESFMQSNILGPRGLGYNPEDETRTESGWFPSPWDSEFREKMRRYGLEVFEPLAKSAWEAASELPQFEQYDAWAADTQRNAACDMALMAIRQLGFSATNAQQDGSNRGVRHVDVEDPFSNGVRSHRNNDRAFHAIEITKCALAMHLSIAKSGGDKIVPLHFTRIHEDMRYDAPIGFTETFSIPTVFRTRAAAIVKRAMLARAREIIVG